MQRFMKIILTKSCGYLKESARGALTNEYPLARVSVIFYVFCIWSNLVPTAQGLKDNDNDKGEGQ